MSQQIAPNNCHLSAYTHAVYQSLNDQAKQSLAGLAPWEQSMILASAQVIQDQTDKDGFVSFASGYTCDPWNMVEAAMGSLVVGDQTTARKIFSWLQRHQLAQGGYCGQYRKSQPCADNQSVHTFSYSAVGLWYWYQSSGDLSVVKEFFPMVERAVELTVSLQTDQGDIPWSISMPNAQGVIKVADDALLSGCCSMAKSLHTAIKLSKLLDPEQDRSAWELSLAKLINCIRYRPDRFDRTWPSKRNFAMDWFYPVLMGCLPTKQAQLRLSEHWNDFIVDGLGCLCTNDNDWVTVAETCELILSLTRIDAKDSAGKLWSWLRFYIDGHGRTEMGYVMKNRTTWPVNEYPTWSAGAVLLAADTLFKISPAHRCFKQTSFELAS